MSDMNYNNFTGEYEDEPIKAKPAKVSKKKKSDEPEEDSEEETK